MIAGHLLMYERRWRSARGGRRLRDCESQPRIPTLRPVLGIELEIRLQAQEALLPGDGKNVTQLGTDRKHPRLKRTDLVAGAAIRTDLVVGITDKADEELL